MGKRGGNKLKYQVEKALKKINKIGVSKKELRDKNQETGIHSTTQIKHALSVNQNFAKWLKQKGVKDLFQLKRAHYRDYIQHMTEKGVTNGHLINIETNLRLLHKGMNIISKEKGFKSRDWCPKKRLVDTTTREQSKNRSLDEQQISKAYEKLSDNAKIGADLQRAFGLRLREVAKTRAAHIIEQNGCLYWKAIEDKKALNTSHGITKAGRSRSTPCNPEMENRIRQIIKNKPSESFLVPLKYNSLKSAYSRANLSGSHSFRHTYARNMLKLDFQQLSIEKQGRDIVERMLINREKGYRKDYQIERSERELYKKVNQVVDRVHGYLGHGESRSDLMQVYMRE